MADSRFGPFHFAIINLRPFPRKLLRWLFNCFNPGTLATLDHRIWAPATLDQENENTLELMGDVIVLYSSAEHLNSMLILAKFIAAHHPTTPVTILCSAPEPAAAFAPSVTYRRLPAAALPPDLTKDPVELFFEIPRLNSPQLRDALADISRKSAVRAFVIDFFCNSAFEVSGAMGIPTYFYISTGGFGVCAFLYFPTIDEKIEKDIGDLDDFIEVPGCPPLHSSDFPAVMLFRRTNTYKYFLSTALNMRKAAGVLANGFDALELRPKEALENGSCVPGGRTPPAYFIGPLVGSAASAEHECLKWLDSQPTGSVVFLCFGRRGLFSGEQLREMAAGLDSSGHRFLWSVRNPPGRTGDEDPDLDALLPEGFLERTKERGFVVKSWAPQREALSHAAVGGFVTHCGRSSVLEAVSFGVPMIGWPMYAEQRMNRVFMVKEMGVALPLEEGADRIVTAAEVEKRVRELMESEKGRVFVFLVQRGRCPNPVVQRGQCSRIEAIEKPPKQFPGERT